MLVRIYANPDLTEWTMVETDKDLGHQTDVDDVPMELLYEFNDDPDPYYADLEPEERRIRDVRRAVFTAYAAGYRDAYNTEHDEDEWCYEDSMEECPTGGWLTGNPQLVTCELCIEKYKIMKEKTDE